MLIEFKIENFLSFKKLTTFSMVSSNDKSLDNNCISIGNLNLLKTTAIYGANASGKSNLFKSLLIVSNWIKESNKVDPNSIFPNVYFKLNKENKNKLSFFEFKFIFNNVKYLYGFKINKEAIVEEYLYYYPNNRETLIFSRENIDNYKFNREDISTLNSIKEHNTKNKFFLATATNWNFAKTKPAYDFFTRNLIVIFDVESLNFKAYKEYYKNENDLKNFAIKLLNNTDFNINEFDVNEEPLTEDKLIGLPENLKPLFNNSSKAYKVITKHKINNKLYSFDIREESKGTQIIFDLIPFIKDVFDNQKVLVIDELDRSLHPFIVKYIVEMFNDTDLNPKGAQLIFNTNDTSLMDYEILRRDQIWFVEKSVLTGESTINSLADFSVRKEENFEKGYLSGRYGSVPNIK